MSYAISGSILVDSLAVLLALYAWSCYRSYNRLKHVPGPPLWGWTVFPLFMVHLRGAIYGDFDQLSKKYGPLVRIAPNTLLLADPDEWRKMNAARSPYTRAPWYVAMRLLPGIDSIISTRDDRDHDERRRKMAAAYSGKENASLEKDIDDCVRDLVGLVERKYISSPPQRAVQMDLARKMQFFTTDVISKLAFDDKFGDLKDDHDNHGYIHEVETLFPNLFCTCTIPSFLYFLTNSGLAKLMAPSLESNFGLGKVFAICKKQVAKRFDSATGEAKMDEGKKDMLASFIRHGLTQSEAGHESMVNLAAGSDTTATALRAILLCVISNPRVYRRLYEEIQNALGKAEAGNSEDDVVSDEQARGLPYLQACIKEGMRWFPPIAGLIPKYTPASGDTICGFQVPGNVSIGYSAAAIHHSALLFGPDEEIFRPERWIHTSLGGDEQSVEKIRAMEKNNELVFGWGRYQCLGKTVAAIEMNKVVCELMRRFDWQLVDPQVPWKTICYGIHFQKNFWVIVRRR